MVKCGKCGNDTNQVYDTTKKIYYIDDNILKINTDFVMKNMCESCMRIIFTNDSRNKSIDYIQFDEYLENLQIGFDNKYNEIKENTKEFNENKIKFEIIEQIRNKLKEVIQ